MANGKMKPIPIAAAARVANDFGYDQVVIVARRVGGSGGEHVTTYGVNPENCSVAAMIGNFFKHKLMGWPGPTKPELADGWVAVPRVVPIEFAEWFDTVGEAGLLTMQATYAAMIAAAPPYPQQKETTA